MRNPRGKGRRSPGFARPGRRASLAVGILSALAALALVGCPAKAPTGGTPEEVASLYRRYRESFPGVPDVTPGELARWLDDGKAVLVDVREPAEREVSRIAPSITKAEFEARRADFRDSRIVLYCTIGYRSGRYARDLRGKGLEAWNLAGGILAWVHAGRGVVDDAGPTRRVHVSSRRWNLLPKGYEAVW